jgi:uncharacterized membrane protein YphA (DoxX/SURF4 family)
MNDPALAPAPLPPATPLAPQPWPVAARVAFYFFFSFWALILAPWPVDSWIPPLGRVYNAALDHALPWIGHHVGIRGDISLALNGSGDRTYDWIYNGTCLALAVLAVPIWAALDRRRRYDRLYDLLRVWVRYYVASTMFSYGILKLFGGQFSKPSPFRYLQAYGDSSPMGLLWTFMGHSKPYVMFSGAAETLGGLLLLSRRTTTIGALVLVGVLGNVVMMNLCYDVPVKLFSSTLLLMSLFLLAPDVRRLIDLFFLQRSAAARVDVLVLPRRWMRIARVVAKVAIIGFMLFGSIRGGRAEARFSFAPKTFFDGIWEIEKVVRDGRELPQPAGDPKTWHRVVVVNQWLNIRQMDSERVASYKSRQDEAHDTIELTPVDQNGDSPKDAKSYTLKATRADHDQITLAGATELGRLELTLRRIDTSKMLLPTRGFHWVSESPYNR